MPTLAIKNQAMTRWYSGGGPVAEVLKQVIRFANIALGKTSWTR